MFIITTDHGRGTIPLKSWKSHGKDVIGAGSVWYIVFGQGITPKGEVKVNEQLYSSQIAPTILKALNVSLPNELNEKDVLNLE